MKKTAKTKIKTKKKVLKVPQEEKGFSKVLVVIGVVVLVGLIGGGYVLSQKTGVSLPGLAAPLNPNCKYNDPDLCKFINNQKEIKDYSARSTSESPDGVKMENMMELNAAGHSHMTALSDGKETYNVISIGDTTYTKDYSDNKWFKMTYKPTEVTGTPEKPEDEFDYAKKSEEVEDKTTYKPEGKEACGERTCFKYQVMDPGITESTEYILFDDREYVLRKTISKSSDGTTTETSFAYSGVKIDVPSPVKEGDANSMYNTNPGGYTQDDINTMMNSVQDDSAGSYDAPIMDDTSSDQ